MRLTAFLLALLVAFAPWSGAIAQWTEQGEPSLPQIGTDHQASMPCHSHVEMQTPVDDAACASCGNGHCNMDTCKCAGSMAGLMARPAQVSLPAFREFHPAYREQATSFQPAPESPPPIA